MKDSSWVFPSSLNLRYCPSKIQCHHCSITILKGTTKLLRCRQPEVANFLRLNVNRDQLLAQLEEWVEDAVVM